MEIIIAITIGVICITFPRLTGKVIAKAFEFITKSRSRSASYEQKKIQPIFSILIGIIIIFITILVKH
ncbi:MAG: hypothetical protein ACJA0H_001016 [Francisellaceae bacterium]|jgi:hypothetical protein